MCVCVGGGGRADNQFFFTDLSIFLLDTNGPLNKRIVAVSGILRSD